MHGNLGSDPCFLLCACHVQASRFQRLQSGSNERDSSRFASSCLTLETRADGVETKSNMVRRMAGGCRAPRTAPQCCSSNAGRRPCAVSDSPAACRWRDLVLAYLQHQHRTSKRRPTLESACDLLQIPSSSSSLWRRRMQARGGSNLRVFPATARAARLFHLEDPRADKCPRIAQHFSLSTDRLRFLGKASGPVCGLDNMCLLLTEYTRQTLNWSHTRKRSQSRETGCGFLAGEAPPSNMMRLQQRRVPSSRADHCLQSPTAARNISGEKTTRGGLCCGIWPSRMRSKGPSSMKNCCWYGTATVFEQGGRPAGVVAAETAWPVPILPEPRCNPQRHPATTPPIWISLLAPLEVCVVAKTWVRLGMLPRELRIRPVRQAHGPGRGGISSTMP